METSSIISVLNTSLSLFSIHCDSAVLVIAQYNALNTLANKFKAPLAFLWLCTLEEEQIKVLYVLSLQQPLL